MITGDHKTTALAIAKQLGIVADGEVALSGDEIDTLTPEELQEKVKPSMYLLVFLRLIKCKSLTQLRQEWHNRCNDWRWC